LRQPVSEGFQLNLLIEFAILPNQERRRKNHHLVKNKSCDLSTRSTDLYQYFLKMANPTANKQLEGIKIDKYDMFSGCIVFYDDQLINQVIVAFDDTDVDELARRVGL
jgi:hypothetical protein